MVLKIKGVKCVEMCLLALLAVSDVTAFGAGDRDNDDAKSRQHRTGDAEQVQLSIQLDLDREIYSETRYKNPPQFAVWIERVEDGAGRTLYATQKLGRGTWNGKPTVPVTLPFWVRFHNRQTGTLGDPTKDSPLPDAITQPTPTDQFNVSTKLNRESVWYCWVEVNVSGDFNQAFPAEQPDGNKDAYGNGQPSLVYRAKIVARPGNGAKFQLVGRTSQWKPSPKLHKNLEGITTAKKLFSLMRVTCHAK